MISKGYVGVFDAPFSQATVRTFIDTWLGSNLQVEQVCPGPHAGNTTLAVSDADTILWEKHLQFRILSGNVFSWVYLSLERRVIETTGLPDEANTLPLDVLIDLPGLQEIVDQTNDRRLDELEAQGLM